MKYYKRFISRISKYNAYIITVLISSVVLLACLIINRSIPFGENFPIGGIGFTQAYSLFVDSINGYKSGNGLNILDYTQGLVSDNYDTKSFALLYMIIRPWLFIVFMLTPPSMYIVVFSISYYLYFLAAGPGFIFYLTHRKLEYKLELSQGKLILLGLMYTMATYNTAYFIYQGFRYMVFVPLIILGLERLVYEKKPVLYVVFLWFIMAADAYSSFLLCIFIVLYFLTLKFDGKRDFIQKGLRFTVGSICSAGLAAFSLIPFYFRTQNSAYEASDDVIPSIFSWFGNILFSLSDLSAFREGVITTPFEYRANIYCGLGAILLFPLYCFSSRIDKKNKLKKIILLLILFLAFDNQLLNFIFHGFHHQWQVPSRYACFFVFVILSIFAEVLENIEEFSKKQMTVSIVCTSAFLIVSYVTDVVLSLEIDSSINSFIPSIFFIAIYVLMLVLLKRNRAVLRLTFVVMCIEVLGSGFISLKFSTSADGTDDTLIYAQKIKSFSDVYEDMKKPFVVTERPGTNDNQNIACMTNTNSLSYYGSTGYKQYQDLLYRWGVLFSTNLTYYTNGSPLADMMLHVDYHVTDSEDLYTNSPYEVVDGIDNLLLHKNKYSLPLGLVLSENDKLDNWNSNSYSFYNNPFDRENDFAHCFDVGDIYDAIQINKIINVEEASDSEENYYIVSEDESGGATLVFMIGTKTSGNIYMQVLNTIQFIGYSSDGCCDTLYFYAPRTVYNAIKKGSSFGIWDEQNFTQLYSELNSNVMTDHKYKKDSISGHVVVSENSILYLTIPYFSGFNVYVDGKPQQIVSYLDGIGINLTKGEHIVEIKYTPEGMWLGIVCSVGSFIAFVMFILISRVKGNTIKKEGND